MTDQVTRLSRIIYDEGVPREKPMHCPACKGKSLELDLLQLEDQTDWETLEACGFDPGTITIDQIARFSYVHSLARCNECGHAWLYGHRWYWNERLEYHANRFRPLWPDERKQIKATQQARAGQLPLPFDGGATR